MLPNATYLTVRAEVPRDAAGDDTDVAFLGAGDRIAVFTDVAGLARYCRVATEHHLRRLEWWEELAEVDDDEVFTPAADSSIDLRRPSADGAELIAEVAAFCDLEDLDRSLLEGDVERSTATTGGPGRRDRQLPRTAGLNQPAASPQGRQRGEVADIRGRTRTASAPSSS